MANELSEYGLDLHSTMILEEYRDLLPTLEKLREVVSDTLKATIARNDIIVTAVEARVKSENSLAHKLELKGEKYHTSSDITDLLGARVITFYSDDVDKIASLVESVFTVDWENSVDKRKMHQLDSFGYDSLHYICKLPESLFTDPEYPDINDIRFEVQMRTALQHVWATLDHDTGYKSNIEVPREYLRSLNRLAGILELADEQFSSIRTSINDYRRKVSALVEDGRFSEVALDAETFRRYLELKPFERLSSRIARINQAEIVNASPMPFLKLLKAMGFKTLGDLQDLVAEYSEHAYQLAVKQLGGTDIDIIASTVGLQNLLIVYIVENGGGVLGLQMMYDMLDGHIDANPMRAARLMDTISQLPFIKKKQTDA